MNYKTDIKPISYIKTHTAKLLDQINETRKPVIITQNGLARGVFIDTQSYQSMRDALSLMKLISQSEQDIKEGKTFTTSEVFKDVNKRIKNVSR